MKRMESFYVIVPESFNIENIRAKIELDYKQNEFDVFTLQGSNETTWEAPISQIDAILIYPTNWIYVYDLTEEHDLKEIRFCEKYKTNELNAIPLHMNAEDFEKFVDFYFKINSEAFEKEESAQFRIELEAIIDEHYDKWNDGQYGLKENMDHAEACKNLILRYYRFNVLFIHEILDARNEWMIYSYQSK